VDALTWIGRQADAIRLLKKPSISELFGESWAASMLARSELFAGRLADALTHINIALDANPDDAWSRQYRAEILSARYEEELARRDWEWVWQHAELDEFYGLVAATWAALGQGLLASARELSNELIGLEQASVDDGYGQAVLGIALLREADETGWEHLEAAAAVVDAGGVDYMERRIRAMLGWRGRKADRLHHLFARRVEQLKLLDLETETERVAGEMGAVIDKFQGDSASDRTARIGARLVRALYRHRAGDSAGTAELMSIGREINLRELVEPAPSPARQPMTGEPAGLVENGAPNDQPPADVTIAVSGDEPDGPVNLAFLHIPNLDAISRMGRGTFPSVSMGVDENLPQQTYRITRRGKGDITGSIERDTWYCKRQWMASLPESVRMHAHEISKPRGVLAIPQPSDDDVVTGLVAWTPLELIARRATEILS
jgi:hypothetical protein